MKATAIPLAGAIAPAIKGQRDCILCHQTFPRAYTGSPMCIGCRLYYWNVMAEQAAQDEAAMEAGTSLPPTGHTDDF